MTGSKLGGTDDRPEVRSLFQNLKAALPELKAIQHHCAILRIHEDGVYRFYHGSFKVYGLQSHTTRIAELLQSLAPDCGLHDSFNSIVAAGTGKEFEQKVNLDWHNTTLPIVTAFQHATYFLDTAIRYGEELDCPPNFMPSGWAAILHLYNLR